MHKEKIDFLICYEHKARELEAIVFLKKELEARGYKVILFSSYEVNLYKYPQIKNKKIKCVITPVGYDTESLFCWCFSIVGLVKKIINLQWEQLLAIEEENDINAYHNPKGFAQKIVHLCWGENTKKRLNWAGVDVSKLFITGPAHLDVLRKPYINYLPQKKDLARKYNLDVSKKWILFISSFSLVDLDEHMKISNRAAMGEAYFDYLYEVSKKTREIILEWFMKFLNNNPDYIIIYRPHPDEINKSQLLTKLEKEDSNFRVISNEGIITWIYNSDVLLNWYSTSEAFIYFSKKQELILRPLKIKKEYDIGIFQDREFVKNYIDFENQIKNPILKKENESFQMRRYYDFDESVYSYKRIADVCEEVLKNKTYNLKYPFILRLKYLKRLFYTRLSSILINIFNLNKHKKIEINKYHEFLLRGFDRNVATPNEILEIENRF